MRLNKRLKNSFLAEFPMKFPEMELPEITDCMTSKPLYFIVDKQLYRGHYHSNGWFYGGDDGKFGKVIAIGDYKNHVKRNSGFFSRPHRPEDDISPKYVTGWCYCETVLIHE